MMFITLLGCFNSDGLKFNSLSGGVGGPGGGSGTLLESFPKVFHADNTTAYFNTIFPTSDGGIILSGYNRSYQVQDALFVKVNSQGQTEWKKLGSIGIYSFSFIQLGQYYYSAGNAIHNQQYSAYLTKLDRNGNTVKILYFDADESYGNLLPLPNNRLIFMYTNQIAKIDTDLNPATSIKWVARINGDYFANYNRVSFSSFTYYDEQGNEYLFFAVNSFNNNPPGICRMNVNSDSISDFNSVSTFKRISGLQEIRSIFPSHNQGVIALGLDQNNNLAILKLTSDLSQITDKKVYSHNLDSYFYSAFVIPSFNNKYLLVIDDYTIGGSIVIVLNNDLSIDRQVVLNMRVRSALPTTGGYIFAGTNESENQALIMSLDSLLNPINCNTVINNEITITFQEVNSPLSLVDSSINISSGSLNAQDANTPTTDANLEEDTTCRASWL